MIQEGEPINKAVIIMYPDCRTTGDFRDPALLAIQNASKLITEFKATTNKVLERYSDQRYSIIGITYQDTTEATFSMLYPKSQFDTLIPVSRPFRRWRREIHPSLLQELVPKLQLVREANIVVGGYHAFDCVAWMVRVLRQNGYQTKPDLLLTNELGELLIAHIIRKCLGIADKEERHADRFLWADKYGLFEKIVSQLS